MTNDEFHALQRGDRLRKLDWPAGKTVTVARARAPFVQFVLQEGLPQGMHLSEIAEWEVINDVR